MGCCASASAEQEVPIKVTNGVEVKDVGNYKLPPTATWPDGEPAARGSWLYCPPNKTGKPMPAAVVVHGACSASGVGQLFFDIVLDVGRDLDSFWTGMEDVAQAIAEQGFVVLMVGMPDHDEKNYPDKIKSGGMLNGWPAVDYARFLSAAIDHMIEVAPKHGVTVDEKKIGLVGHSLGGSGVLYAAAEDCKDKIAAVVALNYGGTHSPTVDAGLEGATKFATGKPFSGEFGEGIVKHFADVKVPTLVYGSQAEYNAGLIPGTPAVFWPYYPSVYAQIGASHKELYVDNLTDNPGTAKGYATAYAHVWCYGAEPIKTYGDGKSLEAVNSFLRRTLQGSTEALMERPANALEWESKGAAAPVTA